MEKLATAEQFRKYLAGDVETYLDAAADTIRRYCGWHVAPVARESLTVKGSGSGELRLPSLRVVEVHSVTANGATVPVDQISSEGGVLTLSSGVWSAGPVVADVTHGFDASDVAALAMSIAARARSTPSGYVRQQAGTMSATPSQMSFNASGGVGLLDWEKRQLDLYRIVGGAQ